VRGAAKLWRQLNAGDYLGQRVAAVAAALGLLHARAALSDGVGDSFGQALAGLGGEGANISFQRGILDVEADGGMFLPR
jgi:hypothetical protein